MGETTVRRRLRWEDSRRLKLTCSSTPASLQRAGSGTTVPSDNGTAAHVPGKSILALRYILDDDKREKKY
jgi:hypothetical protein